MTKLRKYARWISLAAAVLGAVAGYAYYAQVGCVSGTCPITANPGPSALYGAVLFWLIAQILLPGNNRKEP